MSAALDAAKTAWRAVRERANNKSAQLREVNRRAEVFHAELGMMLTWLGMSESKLASVTAPGVSRDTVARQLTDIQSLQNDVERKMRDYEAVGAAARALMESGDIDQDAVSLKLTEVENRWSQLVDGQYIGHSSHANYWSFLFVFVILCICFIYSVLLMQLLAVLQSIHYEKSVALAAVDYQFYCTGSHRQSPVLLTKHST